MINHYYTLVKQVEELSDIVGMTIVECFTQEKDTFIVVLNDGNKTINLQINSGSNLCTLFSNENFSRARKNTIDIFHRLINKKVKNLVLLNNERILRLGFNDLKLFFHLFGASKSNAFIVNSDRKIIDCFKNKKENIGNLYTEPNLELKAFFDFPKDDKILNAFKKSNILLGKYYAEELCRRLCLDINSLIGNYNENELENINKIAINLKKECLDSKKYYIYQNNKLGLLLSLIPLDWFGEKIAEFDSINYTIKERYIRTLRDTRFFGLYKSMSDNLIKQQKKYNENIKHIEDYKTTDERIEKYKFWAELLFTLPNSKVKAGDKIEIKDWSDNIIEITLDPRQTLMENAQKYFEKVKNTRESIKHRQKLLPLYRKKLSRIENGLQELKNISNIKTLEKFKTNYQDILTLKIAEEYREIESKFRVFQLAEGFTLYVGKNAENNDELTMKFAKPNDLWFHARGSGGSHVVLKYDKNRKAGKDIIQKAASVAAYYSQARNAKLTPVAYTFKKYIRKPKGANPGSVSLMREEVIMVKPKLPEVSEI